MEEGEGKKGRREEGKWKRKEVLSEKEVWLVCFGEIRNCGNFVLLKNKG